MARNPHSSSRISHWKDIKTWPALTSERYSRYSRIKPVLRKRPKSNSSARQNADNADTANKGVGVGNPEYSRQLHIRRRTILIADRAQIIAQRQHAIGANQCAGLHRKGQECNQIYQPQQAQEQPGNKLIAGRRMVSTPEKMGYKGQQSAMGSKKSVAELAQSAETGQKTDTGTATRIGGECPGKDGRWPRPLLK